MRLQANELPQSNSTRAEATVILLRSAPTAAAILDTHSTNLQSRLSTQLLTRGPREEK